MKLRIINLTFLLLLILLGCDRAEKELAIHLTEINSRKLAVVDTENWVLFDPIKRANTTLYKIHKIKNDTIIHFKFEVNNNLNRYSIIEYHKTWPNKNRDTYFALTLDGRDTLYMYKIRNLSDIEKTFVIGKYYYLYKYNQLTFRQELFFEAHQDSLIRVKGDNLPTLPGL